MKILALEFSSAQRSVAVADGAGSGSEVIETGAGGLRAFAMIETALCEAKLEREQIECIGVGLGPGSYTGIRAALSIAQGWQLSRGIKLLGVSSVEAIASEAQANEIFGKLNVIIDAQRQEVYAAKYQITADTVQPVEPLKISTPANLQDLEGRFVGPEVVRWFESGNVLFPRAATVARLALGRNDFASGEKLEPIYLRETTFVKAPPPGKFA